MRVTWQVEDGYAGHGTHEVIIPDDDLAECATGDDREAMIERAVRKDFAATVHWCIVSCEEGDD